MIQQTTESRIAATIAEKIPTIEKLQFRAPAKFDGSNIPHYGFFRQDNGQCLNFVARDGYQMTTHDDYVALASAAVDALGDDGEVKCNWTQSKSLSQATIVVAPSKQSRLDGFDAGNGDYIWPRLIITAPFGRTFNVMGGFYRDACRNLSIPKLAGQSFSRTIRHTSGLRAQMDSLIELCRSANNFDSMIDSMRRLNRVETNVVDFLAELYPMPENASSNTTTRAKNRAAAIYSRLHSESIKLGNPLPQHSKTASLWAIVNAVTGYIQHDKTRKNGIDQFDRAVMCLSDVETDAAWKLADSLAS